MYPDCIAYAKTNNLKFFHKTITSINAEPSVYDIAKGVYLKKSYGYVITAGFGGGGGRSPMGRIRGNTPRSNQVQNKQFKDVSKKLKLTKQQRRELHEQISHQGMNYQELLQFAQELFNK